MSRLDAVDWSHRGDYMERRHGISVAMADEALADLDRVVIEPDYNSRSGETVRVIGYSPSHGNVIAVIVLPTPQGAYGVNGWPANSRDQRRYRRAR